MPEWGSRKGQHRRGIYLLPNLLTLAAMFAGFYAMVAGMKGHYENAAIAIFVAVVMDGLDGRIARLVHAQSEFGAQFDSLSDMVSFGITPAVVMYTWSLAVLGKPGWLAAFLYAACTALRLARYNVQAKKIDKRYFQGLATPAAASFVASLIWVCSVYGVTGENVALLVIVVAIALGLLKVSTVRYHSFKDLDLRNKVPFVTILILVLILVLISFDPPDILLLLTFLYVISGPIGTIWALHRRRRLKKIKKNTPP
ncbi:MAG: CDP-diacylglycerol--serine O-phosphatidyltransferase [Coxiella sp. RIFCSPHIGHO2_12_FULL_44_14]|nr:MAG: CDP-diacylglycerol--serine O-phosphatidyltransferase [Coxiella sp. RIFCSPHIGHO2_12_FULL_44_14]